MATHGLPSGHILKSSSLSLLSSPHTRVSSAMHSPTPMGLQRAVSSLPFSSVSPSLFLKRCFSSSFSLYIIFFSLLGTKSGPFPSPSTAAFRVTCTGGSASKEAKQWWSSFPIVKRPLAAAVNRLCGDRDGALTKCHPRPPPPPSLVSNKFFWVFSQLWYPPFATKVAELLVCLSVQHGKILTVDSSQMKPYFEVKISNLYS